MWAKIIGKIIDVCLVTTLISGSAAIVAKAVGVIKREVENNGRNPE